MSIQDVIKCKAIFKQGLNEGLIEFLENVKDAATPSTNREVFIRSI